MACDLVARLSRLRKRSAESVENTNTFDSFKRHLHVERQVEIELRQLLRDINAKQSKCLVLLCGSAGDGKSHLLSYLKNVDSEDLLQDFELYNDATESSEPTWTAIDTLAEKLSAFDDEHWFLDDSRKMIIAINLGTLNNFIESEKGKRYSKLKAYVEASGILSGYFPEREYLVDSVFQHVSFSDYQIFSLGPDGVETDFLEALFGKIFENSSENSFYYAYRKCVSCSVGKRCPVCHNYEFLSDFENQKTIIRRIVKVVIKDKAIVTTREICNLLYDLMVHPDFDSTKICVGTSDITYLTNYLNWTTPMLLNEFADISPLLNTVGMYDVLKERTSLSDCDATRFHSLDNIHDVFTITTRGTPYEILNNLTDVSVLGGIKAELKKIIYRFICRLREFKMNLDPIQSSSRLDQFISYLYLQNSGNEKSLGELYKATRLAALNWNGQFGDDCICIDDSNEMLWVLEELQLKAVINKNAIIKDGSIRRFSPMLKLKYRDKRSMLEEFVELNMDFSLYELILDIREGYRPTVQDKNRHADFASFVQRSIEFGNKSEEVFLIPKESGKKYKVIFKKTEFQFEFRVV